MSNAVHVSAKALAQINLECRTHKESQPAVIDRWMRERKLAEGIKKLRPPSTKIAS